MGDIDTSGPHVDEVQPQGKGRTISGRWDPRGGELLAKAMLVEIDELEPADYSGAPVATSIVEREINVFLAKGLLGGLARGISKPLDEHVQTRLCELGRQLLLSQGIAPQVFYSQYFSAKDLDSTSEM